MSADNQQRLVLAIIDFLKRSIDDGTVKQDDREGLDVASKKSFGFY
jgi:small glutamine-rich tetratricopeptide repeat-containing protein alpha